LHPSYLPYNRGELPATFAILEGTPAGATLHYMDSGLDTGPIIEREQVTVTAWDTAYTVYRRSMEAGINILKRQWPRLVAGVAGSYPQPPLPAGVSQYHRRDSTADVDQIMLTPENEYLMRLLRARTWHEEQPGNAYFTIDGKRVRVRVHLDVEETG